MVLLLCSPHILEQSGLYNGAVPSPLAASLISNCGTVITGVLDCGTWGLSGRLQSGWSKLKLFTELDGYKCLVSRNIQPDINSARYMKRTEVRCLSGRERENFVACRSMAGKPSLYTAGQWYLCSRQAV